MVTFLKKIVGDTPERAAEKLRGQLVPIVNELEDSVCSLDDAGLRAKTDEFRSRLADGESLDDLLPEAFAVVREAARRQLGQRHYDVQLIGGAVLHQGKIAEMKTGEGKTLVATLPAYLNALTGDGVHVVTVNDYLARRDPVWMGPVYNLLGLTVGCLQHDAAYIYDPELLDVGRGGFEHLRPALREDAYQADVLYGTNSEFGFDYLRDNIATRLDLRAQHGRGVFAIVDEVDNILIDEARTPLIISGPAQQRDEYYRDCDRLASRLREYEDYTIDDRTQAISLTEAGIARAERHLRVENLYDPENFHLVQYVENAVVAHVQKIRDKDYVVQNGEVIIVDEFTGRMQFGRRWSDGLHQAVETKEGIKPQTESITYATITLQNYFRLYDKLAGMTGTAVTEAEEFYKIYGLEVVAVPTNQPMIRDDATDLIFATDDGKWNAVVNNIIERSGSGQPVLVGTTSVETSEFLSDRLRKRGVPHQVLNARNHEQEASIIAQAGRSGAVTVSTNMAGRGTDIVLGGADTDRDDWQEEHNRVIGLGGLHVIGTEHHEARRVDNQLRGRAGRQGDPGSSQFFVALEDELMQRFGGDRIKNVMSWTGLNDDEPLENKLITKSINSAQVKVEGHHFDLRKHLLNFDDVLQQQRTVIYEQRSRILAGDGLQQRLIEMLLAEFDDLIATHLQARHADDWNVDGFLAGLRQICPPPPEMNSAESVLSLRKEQIADVLEQHAETLYQAKERELGSDGMATLVRLLMLKSIDTHWVNHLTQMEDLRTGVGLQAVGQRDPLTVYRTEGQRAFTELNRQMQREITHTLFHVTLAPEAPGQRTPPDAPLQDDAPTARRGRAADRAPVSPMAAVASSGRTAVAPQAGRKIGRNAKCPCGSGRKYKRCCGANS
ncbi:MAG: preprotein translocase subunit SecA [Chloroflexi bacterium]|nr:preprotein translocase subunit SecA [Chloroflexota bacterium]MYD49233.1 preprotein translocase subunit SecA [Chloroflexota bacterium]